MKARKKIVVFLSVCFLMSITAISALASFDWFAGRLPKNQGDTEVCTLTRTNPRSSYSYFTIDNLTIDSPYDFARAWTESPAGVNYSDPYNLAYVGSTDIPYNYGHTPNAGDSVVLNLDNYYYTIDTPVVQGWFNTH